MDWDILARRQGVTEWRDRQILQARVLLNEHAREARAAFEEGLAEATVLDSVWDPAGFAHARIDTALGQSMRPALTRFLDEAAAELILLDPAFAALAESMRTSGAVTLPLPPSLPPPPPSLPSPAAETLKKGALYRIADRVAGTATAALDYASQSASWLLQDKVGLRERLREAAMERIAQRWTGSAAPASAGGERPVLSQIIALIDEVARNARTVLQ